MKTELIDSKVIGSRVVERFSCGPMFYSKVDGRLVIEDLTFDQVCKAVENDMYIRLEPSWEARLLDIMINSRRRTLSAENPISGIDGGLLGIADKLKE